VGPPRRGLLTTGREVIPIAAGHFAKLEQTIGFSFRDRRLLQQAFVHRSYLNENPAFSLPSNERLEFLGDAVLGLIVAESLYHTYPDLPEGQLTRLRASLVQQRTLAQVARSLSLGEYLYLGRGEEASGGRQRPSLLASTFEALLGALYLDQGLEAARRLVLNTLKPEERLKGPEAIGKDYKSRLQEVAQAQRQTTPVYRTVAEEGPDHEKQFTVEVLVGGQVMGRGIGHSKQDAEQRAAQLALLDLEAGAEREG
jgi:ribonuclease-3